MAIASSRGKLPGHTSVLAWTLPNLASSWLAPFPSQLILANLVSLSLIRSLMELILNAYVDVFGVLSLIRLTATAQSVSSMIGSDVQVDQIKLLLGVHRFMIVWVLLWNRFKLVVGNYILIPSVGSKLGDCWLWGKQHHHTTNLFAYRSKDEDNFHLNKDNGNNSMNNGIWD